MTKPLRFAMLGAGFWSRYQMAAWQEIGGVACVAVANRSVERAERLSSDFGLEARVYSDPEKLFRNEEIDFVDIVTNVETHCSLVHLAASHGVPVICQKPMASSWQQVKSMVSACNGQDVPFFVHENWRWQSPIRALKRAISRSDIGEVYRARIRMVSGFPVFENQPSLKELEQFLLMDMGSHILDVARFLFGEPVSLYCTISRVQRDVKGEDVATVVLKMATGATVICELGYAGTPLEYDHFPQTFALVECGHGSVELAAGYQVRVTTMGGTESFDARPPQYAWADPAYEVVHASIVDCHRDLLAGLRGDGEPETRAEDNCQTMRLVFSAYESARTNEVISF